MTDQDTTRARFDEIRGLIDENDARIVGAVNERLRLVSELWRLKTELELPLFDAGREQRLRAALAEANDGPLSEPGLDTLLGALLALTRSELGAPEPPTATSR
jgi:chorismate mutase